MDKWMLTKISKIAKSVEKKYLDYDIAGGKRLIENLFWHTFCDNYLEIIKQRVYNGVGNDKVSAQYTLYQSLLVILKMVAPIMPHITEEIYSLYFKDLENLKSIHLSSWPEYGKDTEFSSEEKTGDVFVEVLSSVRKYKSDNNISLRDPIKKLIINSGELKKNIKFVIEDFKGVTKAGKIVFDEKLDKLENMEIGIKIQN